MGNPIERKGWGAGILVEKYSGDAGAFQIENIYGNALTADGLSEKQEVRIKTKRTLGTNDQVWRYVYSSNKGIKLKNY